MAFEQSQTKCSNSHSWSSENLTGFQNVDCSYVIYVAKSVFGIDHIKNLSGLDLELE
jgi:hypothetical protein